MAKVKHEIYDEKNSTPEVRALLRHLVDAKFLSGVYSKWGTLSKVKRIIVGRHLTNKTTLKKLLEKAR